jgi:hypothetical protein
LPSLVPSQLLLTVSLCLRDSSSLHISAFRNSKYHPFVVLNASRDYHCYYGRTFMTLILSLPNTITLTYSYYTRFPLTGRSVLLWPHTRSHS